jgi:16S rRNA (guanine966-N2)-methyltransferase
VGIEAISRGATHATFVDQSRKMCALIASNLELCRVQAEQSSVVHAEASEFLRSSVKRASESWDIVFFDPPYGDDYLAVLGRFAGETRSLLKETGLLVVEHHHKKSLPDELGNVRRQRILKQGDSALSLYEQKMD